MLTDLTAEQVEHYRRDGFLHLPRFLDAAEVGELKAAVLSAIGKLGDRKTSGDGNDWKNDDYSEQVFTQKMNLWKVDDVVRSYIARPQLGRMLCELAGIDGVRVWHDQALIKEPFANPTALHLDVPFWSFHSRDAISIWIALEDATVANGCLCFLPGSHRIAGYDNARVGSSFGDLIGVYPAMGEIDPVLVPMKAGDCSFHNGLIAHGAGPNMTRGRRLAMTCAYMPQGSRFNGTRNILSQRYLATLSVGDLLDEDAENPRVYPV